MTTVNNPNIIISIKDGIKSSFENINNVIITEIVTINQQTIPIMVNNNINNNIINEIVQYCNKLDNSIKYSHSLKEIGSYLSDLVELFNCDVNDTVLNTKFIQDCVDMFILTDNKHINTKIYCDKDYSIKYNNITIKQVLLNLISNAYKYNYDNGYITVKVYKKGQSIVLSVYNTGCGLLSNCKNICNVNYHNVESNKLGLNHCIYLLDNPTITIESCENEYFKIDVEL